ncbi:Imm30 family immunity protein [Achromobacter pestifer]
MSGNSLGLSILKLKSAVESSGEGRVAEIDSAISEVVSFKDPESIIPLLCLLRDSTLYDPSMYSLIHAAEMFEGGVYISKFLLGIPILRNDCPAWASVLLMRIINSSSGREELTRQLRNSSFDTKKAVLWLIEEINKEDPSFIAKTMAPLLAAKS